MMGFLDLNWEQVDLLRRGVESLESIAASLVKMNRLTEEGLKDRKISDLERKSTQIRRDLRHG